MPNHIPLVAGALFGLGVRFWRYKPKIMFVLRDLSFGLVSMISLWHLLPSDMSDMWTFITAYFTAQSASHGGSLLLKK